MEHAAGDASRQGALLLSRASPGGHQEPIKPTLAESVSAQANHVQFWQFIHFIWASQSADGGPSLM